MIILIKKISQLHYTYIFRCRSQKIRINQVGKMFNVITWEIETVGNPPKVN